MSFTPAFAHLAAYNQWMNRKLYNAAAVLPDEALMQHRGAFFGSLFGTLSHLVVADTIWLQIKGLGASRGIALPQVPLESVTGQKPAQPNDGSLR